MGMLGGKKCMSYFCRGKGTGLKSQMEGRGWEHIHSLPEAMPLASSGQLPALSIRVPHSVPSSVVVTLLSPAEAPGEGLVTIFILLMSKPRLKEVEKSTQTYRQGRCGSRM